MAQTPASKKPKKIVPREPVPCTIREFADYERDIGTLLTEIDTIRQAAEEAKKQVDVVAELEIGPKKDRLIALAKAMRTYAETKRGELTQDDTVKIVSVGDAGTIRWLTTPPSIVIKKDDLDDVITYLIKHHRHRFVRRKIEVNKEALGDHLDIAEAIPGISVERTPKFVIKPAGRDDRVECNLDTNRWKIVESSSEDITPSVA